MAEWFKATDLRPVIYDAWVRTPLSAEQGTYGSLANPPFIGRGSYNQPKRNHPNPFFMISSES